MCMRRFLLTRERGADTVVSILVKIIIWRMLDLILTVTLCCHFFPTHL